MLFFFLKKNHFHRKKNFDLPFQKKKISIAPKKKFQKCNKKARKESHFSSTPKVPLVQKVFQDI